MEGMTRIALSEKILSRCHLLGTELLLLQTSAGLSLKWIFENKDDEDRIYSSHITSSKAYGKLYPIQLNAELEMAIFGRRLETRAQKSSRSPVACVVVLNTGSVMVAHRKEAGQFSFLCHQGDSAVWSGVIKGKNGKCAMAIVGKGSLYTGLPKKRPVGSSNVSPGSNNSCSLLWKRETLKISPVVCCGFNNVIFMSDGVTSRLSIFDIGAKGYVVDHKCHSLPYYGVIRIKDVNESAISLVTCDGRTYRCDLKHLIESVRSEKPAKSLKSRVPRTVEEVMNGVQRCSEMVQKEGKHIHNMNVYMNQLSLAIGLLAGAQNDIFSATVRVEQHFGQRGMYVALVSLKKILDRVDFDGKWWKLSISVPGRKSIQTMCVKLDGHYLNKVINLSIPLPDLDILHSLSPIKITCHLILSHYGTLQPVCQVLACHVMINIVHFLTHCHRHSSVDSVKSSCNFTSVIHKLSLKKQFAELSPRSEYAPMPPCHVKVSFANNGINKQLLISLLNLAGSGDLSPDEDSNQVQLWYHDIPVDVQYWQKNGKLFVLVSGPNPPLALSLKAALERQVIDRGSTPSLVMLSSEVFEEAQQFCNVFDYEYSKATTRVVLSHLHEMVGKILCNVPL